MAEQVLFEGQKNYLKWPFLDFETTDDIVEITKYRLQLLFSVIQGERLGNIRYGNTLWMRVFNQLTDTERVIIETEILEMLKKYMPDLIIDDVIAEEGTWGNNAVISISFTLPRYDSISATFRIGI